VREWGETVWVQARGGSKVGGHVRKERWLGFDDRAMNWVWVYYPDDGTIRSEQKVWTEKTHATRQSLASDDWNLVDNNDAPVPASIIGAPPPVSPAFAHVIPRPFLRRSPLEIRSLSWSPKVPPNERRSQRFRIRRPVVFGAPDREEQGVRV
jgi:hypothetical protein